MKTTVTLNIGLFIEKTNKEISTEEVLEALIDSNVQPLIAVRHESQQNEQVQHVLVVRGEVPLGWTEDALTNALGLDVVAVLEHGAEEQGQLYGPNPNGYSFNHDEFITIQSIMGHAETPDQPTA